MNVRHTSGIDGQIDRLQLRMLMAGGGAMFLSRIRLSKFEAAKQGDTCCSCNTSAYLSLRMADCCVVVDRGSFTFLSLMVLCFLRCKPWRGLLWSLTPWVPVAWVPRWVWEAGRLAALRSRHFHEILRTMVSLAYSLWKDGGGGYLKLSVAFDGAFHLFYHTFQEKKNRVLDSPGGLVWKIWVQLLRCSKMKGFASINLLFDGKSLSRQQLYHLHLQDGQRSEAEELYRRGLLWCLPWLGSLVAPEIDVSFWFWCWYGGRFERLTLEGWGRFSNSFCLLIFLGWHSIIRLYRLRFAKPKPTRGRSPSPGLPSRRWAQNIRRLCSLAPVSDAIICRSVCSFFGQVCGLELNMALWETLETWIATFVVPYLLWFIRRHFVHSVTPTPRHCLNKLAVIAKETGRTGELVRAPRGVFYQRVMVVLLGWKQHFSTLESLAGETETLWSSFWSMVFC